MKFYDSFLKKLEAKDEAKWAKKKLAYEKKTEMAEAIKHPLKIDWLEDQTLYDNVAALQEAKYKKMQEHKKQVEQMMLYGISQDHNAATGNDWWIATNDSKTWAPGSIWSVGGHSHHAPAWSASASTSVNYTQVFPANYEDAFKPKMTREKAIALNDGAA